MGRRSVGWVSLYRQETRISSPALDILPTCLNWLVEIHWGILLLIGTGKSYCKWGRRALEARWCCSAVLWGSLQFALIAWEPSDFLRFRSQVCSFRLCGAQLHLQQQSWVCRWCSHQATVLFSARAGFRSLSSVLLCFYRDMFGNLPREWLGKIKNHLKMKAAKKKFDKKTMLSLAFSGNNVLWFITWKNSIFVWISCLGSERHGIMPSVYTYMYVNGRCLPIL